MNCLGDRIRYIRHKRDFTIDQLAELTGLSYGSIRAYEHSDRYPNTDSLIKICNILKVTPDYLLQDEIYYNLISNKSKLFQEIDSFEPTKYNLVEQFVYMIKAIKI